MQKISKHIILILSIILSVFFSCSEEERTGTDIYMIGDSIIKGWELDEYSNHPIHNWGINGAGLETIKQFHVEDISSWIVCIIGTNDLQFGLTQEQRKSYVEDYMSTISKLGGNQIVLFSVLPSSKDNRHEQIPFFNDLVRLKVKEYPLIHYIDVYDYFLAEDNKSIKDELTKDGLHLNNAGYQYLNTRLKDVIRDL